MQGILTLTAYLPAGKLINRLIFLFHHFCESVIYFQKQPVQQKNQLFHSIKTICF